MVIAELHLQDEVQLQLAMKINHGLSEAWKRQDQSVLGPLPPTLVPIPFLFPSFLVHTAEYTALLLAPTPINQQVLQPIILIDDSAPLLSVLTPGLRANQKVICLTLYDAGRKMEVWSSW